MEYEQQFSSLVYDYLLKRLQFGYYVQGDSLPTVEVLRQEFNVSDHTIWSALRRLRADGYISMKNGRATKVVYQQTEQERRESVISYFSERWEAYYELYEATELLYVPLIIEGLRRMNEQEKNDIFQLSKRASADDIILFYYFALQKIDNPLLLNLFWETSLFLGFPFTKANSFPFRYDVMVGREQFSTLIGYIKNASWASVQKALIQYQRGYIDWVIKSMEQEIPAIPKIEQIPFVWRVYRDRPQICYQLATHLLHEIYMAEYRQTKFLPSYETMAEKYNVSVSSMRRTVGMLNQIGAARTINGKGTRIFTIGESCCRPDFTSAVVRRNLSYFMQSFEILFYTCEGVTMRFLSLLPAEEREELIRRFEKNQGVGLSGISIWHYLLFIAKHSLSKAIGQIYGTIYGLFLWGYPLKASLESVSDVDRRGEEFTVSMIKGLKENDAEQCASAVKTYIQTLLPLVRQFLIQNGIEAEELRLSPSIRLLLVND